MDFSSGETTTSVTNIENKDKCLELPTDSNTWINSLLESNRFFKNCTWENDECHKENVEK